MREPDCSKGRCAPMPRAWQDTASLTAARSNWADRCFARASTLVPGHFARTERGPGRSARAGPVLARAAPVPGHSSRPLLGHFARAGPVLGHFARPALGHLVPAVRAGPVAVHRLRPPKSGIDSTGLRVMADGCPFDSDR